MSTGKLHFKRTLLLLRTIFVISGLFDIYARHHCMSFIPITACRKDLKYVRE